MNYDFKMIQLPQTFMLKQDTGSEIARYLEKIAYDMGVHGWEFFRIDQVGVMVSPGCLASIFGARETMTYYNIATFRRLRNGIPATQEPITQPPRSA